MKTSLIALLTATMLASPVLADTSAKASNEGTWLVRGRLIDITPTEDSTVSVGGAAEFSNEVVPEVDFTYFFTNNIAAELIVATAKHEATARNTSLGTLDVGSAWVLPPTLTLQYHFTNFESFKPYVGAGINYTMYLGEDPGTLNSLKMDNDFGYALQAGVDVPLNDKWSWNLDVKKIMVDADASWNNGGVTAQIDLNPWVFGTGFGYRF